MGDFQLDERAQEYARRHGLKFNLKQQLGAGTDGNVWATSRRSAIKVFSRERTYLTELGCYRRLASKQIREIDGLTIPRLLDYADDLWIIEISLVHPPYLLDFGKAYIDEPSPYTPEQLAEWRQSWVDFFPGSDLPRVHKVLRLLMALGIEYVDPKPWNIRFRTEGDRPDDADVESSEYFSEEDG
ncbi:MAG TPA: hypothetical protein VIK18_10695 [Pirellulales bacterium]